MFQNLILHSIRALRKQRSFVIINIAGLAIGVACSLMIGLFIMQQTGYDNYHEHKDKIYQLFINGRIAESEFRGAFLSPPVGAAMVREFPEVENFLRLNKINETVIKYETQSFIENQLIEADSTFFDFFSIRLIRGNPESALNQPFTVVLTESTAIKIFGDEDPMDKYIRIGMYPEVFRITGIIEEVPANTHFRANMISSFLSNNAAQSQNWLNNSFSTYVMIHEDARPELLKERIQEMVNRHAGPQVSAAFGIDMEDFLNRGNKFGIEMQPLRKIKLNPNVEQNLSAPNDPRYLAIFGSIGILILLIAAINFMNLSTAQATKRAKEVVVKKVSGSSQALLIWQFLFETIFLAMVSMLMALLITELTLPMLNKLLETDLYINYLNPWYFIPALILIGVVVGIFSGIYPAFYLSSFNPVRVLKGKGRSGNELINIRRVLTTLQFAISIILIIGTMIMYRQINFMLNKPLGFDKENIMVLQRAAVLGSKAAAFKNDLLLIAGVSSVSASTYVPGRSDSNNGYTIVGRPDETFILSTNWVDHHYLETYGLEIAEGRFFDENASDQNYCIINYCSLKRFGIEDAFSTQFLDATPERIPIGVIGVIKDYHLESLRMEIKPHILKIMPEQMSPNYMSIRLQRGIDASVIEKINALWNEFTAGEPMLYFFMDENIKNLYGEEKQNASLAMVFTVLAIIIASLGLFGLTSFTVSQKTKEIGIRKTFGASTGDIWMLIIRESLMLIIISTAIAWPLIFWVAQNWLQNYYYRIDLNVADFIAGVAVAMVIAISTISYKAIEAARSNPSISLRYE
jgi:putative ABC transport system permease protein